MKHEKRSRATRALTESACSGEPRREIKSEAVALGLGEREALSFRGSEKGAAAVVVKEAAPAREMENIKANLSGSDELILLVAGELASTPLNLL